MDPLTFCLIAAFFLVSPVERVMHARKGTTPPGHQARMKRLDKSHEARMARMKAGRMTVGEALQQRIAEAVATRKPRTPIHERGPAGKFFGLWYADAMEWATAARRNVAGATGEARANWKAKRENAKAEKTRQRAEKERKQRDEDEILDVDWSEVDEQEPFTPTDDTEPAEPTMPEPKAIDAPVVEPVEPTIPTADTYQPTEHEPEPMQAELVEPDPVPQPEDDTPLAPVYQLHPVIEGEPAMPAPAAITSGTEAAPIHLGEITNLAEAQAFTQAFATAADNNLSESKMRADKLATAATIADVDAAAYQSGSTALITAVEQIQAAKVGGQVLPTLSTASAAMQEVASLEAQVREQLASAAALSARAAELMATVRENVAAANTDLHRHDGLQEQHQALAGDGGDKHFYANA